MKPLLKLLFIVLLLFNGSELYAQKKVPPTADSLLRELESAKEDTGKVNILNAISRFYYYNDTNKNEGIKMSIAAIALAGKLKFDHGLATAYFITGSNYFAKSDFANALDNELKALKIYEQEHDKKDIAVACETISATYRYHEDNTNALKYCLEGLKLDEEGGRKSELAADMGQLCLIYSNLGDNEHAKAYALKALAVNEEIRNEVGISISYTHLCSIYLSLGYPDQGLTFGLKALSCKEKMGDKYGMMVDQHNIGDCYMQLYKASVGNNVQARQHDTSKKHAPKMNNHSRELDNAVRYLKRSIGLCEALDELTWREDGYKLLAEAYKLKGDPGNALQCMEYYMAIRDSVFSRDNEKKLVKIDLDGDYQRRRLADSLVTLTQQKAAALKLQKQKSYTYMGLGGILLLAAFSFFIVKERRKSEKLLLNILPREVAAELKDKGATKAKQFDNVTVLFTDFVNFTSTSEHMNPQSLIDELHTCFKAFDEITSRHNIEKIKTIGDAYLAVCGLPTSDSRHAENAVSAAKEINAFMQDRLTKSGSRTFEIRIGIHSGSVVAGIVGVKKFAYDIWGDTVNTAARMEQNSEAGKINISETTYELVKDKFNCEYRGEIAAKGKGMMKMYYVS